MLVVIRPVAVFIVLMVMAAGVCAQEAVAVQGNVLFYGDNTEFRNPFREGETIFGAAVRIAGAVDFNERTTLTLGVFGNQRFGSDDAFELVRPIVSLRLRGGASTFVFGTLPASPHASARGPDLNGPHGLLPPIQRETLAFDRPYEAGLQWLFAGGTLRHDVWLQWQRLNTAEHRERLDAGFNGEIRLSAPFTLGVQTHIVHEGGQLFASGPVADSVAGAVGARLAGRVGNFDAASIEGYVLASRFVPDRSVEAEKRSGVAVLMRASGERSGWRGHLLVWRGRDFVKDEGDLNYLSIRRNGVRYRGTRDYSEAGLTRIFKPAPGVDVHASARLHRTEKHYEYSYRILAIVAAEWKRKITR